MRAYNNSQGTHRRESRAQFFNILPSACTIFAPFRRALSLFILRLKINISHRNNGSQLCLYPRLYMHTASFLRCCLSPFIWRWLSPQKIPPANRLITNIDNEETIVWTLPDDYVCNSCRFCFFFPFDFLSFELHLSETIFRPCIYEGNIIAHRVPCPSLPVPRPLPQFQLHMLSSSLTSRTFDLNKSEKWLGQDPLCMYIV